MYRCVPTRIMICIDVPPHIMICIDVSPPALWCVLIHIYHDMYRCVFPRKLKYIMMYWYICVYRCGPSAIWFQCINIFLLVDTKNVSIFAKISILILYRFGPSISIYSRANYRVGQLVKSMSKKEAELAAVTGTFSIVAGGIGTPPRHPFIGSLCSTICWKKLKSTWPKDNVRRTWSMIVRVKYRVINPARYNEQFIS
jgi:hypothetical protein